MGHTKVLIWIGLIQLASLSVATAGENLDAIKKTGVITIGTEGTYAPFSFHDKDGKLVGFDVEIGEAIAAHLKVEPKFVEAKWDGLIAGLDASRYDTVLNQITITDARKQKYAFSDPYISSQAVLIVRSDNDSVKAFADLNGKKSANTLASTSAKIAEENGAQVVPTNGFDQSAELVAAGRVDATINDNLAFLDFLKHKPEAPLKVVAQHPDADQQAIILRKGDPDFVSAINEAIAAIKKDGTYAAISKKYFGKDLSK